MNKLIFEFLKSCHENIFRAKQQSIHLLNLKETKLNIPTFLSHPDTIFVLDQIPPAIKQKIVTHLGTQGNTIECTIFQRLLHIRVHIVFFQTTIAKKEYYDIMQYICAIFHFFGKEIIQRSGLRKINIYLFLTNIKKTFPLIQGDGIGSVNVNSGYTFYSMGNDFKKDICIFRREEWKKVIIHEIIHSLNIEFCHSFSKQVDGMMSSSIFKGVGGLPPLLLFETYVEVWATLLHILFTISNIKFRVNEFERKLQKEQIWAIIQYIRLLRHYSSHHLSSPQHFNLLSKEKQFVQKDTSNSYAYYILKARMLFHLPIFFEFIFYKKQKQTHTFPSNYIVFERTKSRVLDFFEIIRRLYSPPLSTIWESACREILLQEAYSHVFPNSLRMTYTSL